MKEVKHKRVLIAVLVILLILFVGFFIIKFFILHDEWVCKDGSWVKRGNPSTEMPSYPCGEPLVGGDRDEHGCIGSAGYSWCEEKQKCLRIWEENCSN